MRRPASEAAIASALTFENVHARRSAASALAAIGTFDARDALLRAGAADPDPDVREICAAVVRS
jgi:HEAT repeat protein